MRLKLKLMHMGLAIALVPLVFELFFLVVLAVLLYQVEVETKNLEHSRSVICDVDALTGCITDAGMKLFDIAVSGDFSSSKQFEEELEKGRGKIQSLHQLITDRAQVRKLNELQVAASKLMTGFESGRSAIQDDVENGTEVKRKFTQLTRSKQSKLDWKGAIDSIGALSDELVDMEVKLHPSSQAQVEETRERVKLFIRLGFILNVVLALGLAGVFATRIAGRLRSIAENASRLSRQEQLLPMISGSDEIAELDMAFHQMAGALKEASRRERAVIDNATEVICSLTATGNFTSVNPATISVWVRQPDELIGKHFSTIVHADDVDAMQKALQEIVTSTSTGQFECRIVRGDSTIGYFMWSVRWDNTQKVLFCVTHDISQRKELERMKSEFLAMVSHDVRTPLSSMKSILTLLSVEAYGDVDHEGKARIEVTERDVDRVLMLINNLLDLDKMEEGKFAIDAADTTSGVIVESAIDATADLIELKGLEVEVLDSNVAITADKNRLVQAMVNLLTALIDSAPRESEVVIDVTEEDGVVRFAITGVGTATLDNEPEVIFSRFSQVPDGRGHGAGLGLPIAKAIVEAHGGEIGVSSDNPGSTVFWFTIPNPLCMVLENDLAAGASAISRKEISS